MSRNETLTEKIKSEAIHLGFSAFGVSQAAILTDDAERFSAWLKSGFQGEMGYMKNHFKMRFNPELLVENAKSVISLAYNYYSSEKQVAEAPIISKYAFGKDYHIVIREKLNNLLDFIKQQQNGIEGRCFVDSAPIAEKAWAQRSGIGWIGKNSNIIISDKGSFHFLAELVLNIELEYSKPVSGKCGSCTRCIDLCPTGAIVKPYVVDSRKCISYLTIELKGEIPEEFNGKLANRMYGCDICQNVCPWNIRFALEHTEPMFLPSQELLSKTKDEWETLTEDEFKIIFKKSAVKRAKYSGLKRNIEKLEK